MVSKKRGHVELNNNAEEADSTEERLSVPMPAKARKQGFKQWRTTTKLATGGKLAEMSTYDTTAGKFSHTVKVQHTDAFTLRPLIMTEGPLAGRQILVLDPVSTFFRFNDLPPEIRQIVYDLLLREDEHVSITTCKPRGTLRRACRYPASTVSNKESKAGIRTSSNVLDTLLRISKQVASEAATTIYGNNTFFFDNISNMEIFLDGIGTMRKHLRYLRIACGGYTASKARPAFSLLKDATSLRTLSLHHKDVYFRMDHVAADLRTLLKTLLNIQAGQKVDGKSGGLDVRSIVKIRGSTEMCKHCAASPKRTPCLGYSSNTFDCDYVSTHCLEVEEEIRETVRKSIGARW